MASIEQVKNGAAKYLDEEFTNKMTGWQKWVFGAGAAMYLENLGSTVERLKSNEIVKTLKIIDETGNINTERVSKFLMLQAQKGPITFDMPIVGKVTLSASDVEKLYRYIEEA